MPSKVLTMMDYSEILEQMLNMLIKHRLLFSAWRTSRIICAAFKVPESSTEDFSSLVHAWKNH